MQVHIEPGEDRYSLPFQLLADGDVTLPDGERARDFVYRTSAGRKSSNFPHENFKEQKFIA